MPSGSSSSRADGERLATIATDAAGNREGGRQLVVVKDGRKVGPIEGAREDAELRHRYQPVGPASIAFNSTTARSTSGTIGLAARARSLASASPSGARAVTANDS